MRLLLVLRLSDESTEKLVEKIKNSKHQVILHDKELPNNNAFFSFLESTAELKAELGAQVERERELKEQLEKQLTEEQKIRSKS